MQDKIVKFGELRYIGKGKTIAGEYSVNDSYTGSSIEEIQGLLEIYLGRKRLGCQSHAWYRPVKITYPSTPRCGSIGLGWTLQFSVPERYAPFVGENDSLMEVLRHPQVQYLLSVGKAPTIPFKAVEWTGTTSSY